MTRVLNSHIKYLIVCALLLLVSCSQQTKKKESSSETKALVIEDAGVLFKRNTIVVADLERSLQVYKDILGFSFSGEIKTLDDAADADAIFKIPEEANVRFIALNSPTQERTLAITEVKGVPLAKNEGPLTSSMVIRIDDFDTVMQKIEHLKLETTALQVVEKEKYIVKQQAFFDFDGHSIVLYNIMNK